jgi:hypothetical protein
LRPTRSFSWISVRSFQEIGGECGARRRISGGVCGFLIKLVRDLAMILWG